MNDDHAGYGSMFAQKYVWLVIVVGSLFACAAPEVPKAHNDPSKYTVAQDVLWASPDGFDLTMDIYCLLYTSPSPRDY